MTSVICHLDVTAPEKTHPEVVVITNVVSGSAGDKVFCQHNLLVWKRAWKRQASLISCITI